MSVQGGKGEREKGKKEKRERKEKEKKGKKRIFSLYDDFKSNNTQ